VAELIDGSTSKRDAEFSKPSPEIFRVALRRIGTDADVTITVGDTPYDILASHRAALPIAAVLSGVFQRDQLTKAEFLFADVAELVRKLDIIDAYFHE
jgi:phosphoglycolate phosphatase-like HAD superfamily hydrolase